jgi:hypothetical protein
VPPSTRTPGGIVIERGRIERRALSRRGRAGNASSGHKLLRRFRVIALGPASAGLRSANLERLRVAEAQFLGRDRELLPVELEPGEGRIPRDRDVEADVRFAEQRGGREHEERLEVEQELALDAREAQRRRFCQG